MRSISLPISAGAMLHSLLMLYFFPCRYAAGATIQIVLFGILAVQIKMKAPTAHTVLEIVHARWGNVAHLVSCFLIPPLAIECGKLTQLTCPTRGSFQHSLRSSAP